jgi:hypothetical protein
MDTLRTSTIKSNMLVSATKIKSVVTCGIVLALPQLQYLLDCVLLAIILVGLICFMIEDGLILVGEKVE